MPHRSDVIYIHDGSFEGLLTAVFEAYAPAAGSGGHRPGQAVSSCWGPGMRKSFPTPSRRSGWRLGFAGRLAGRMPTSCGPPSSPTTRRRR